MPLHRPNQVGVGGRLRLVFADFLDAVDQAPTIGAIEEGLSVGRTELQVGDDVGLTDPDGQSLKTCCGGNRLVMAGNDSTTLRHRDLQR